MQGHPRRPSTHRAIRNFLDSDIPMPARLARTARNLWIRVALRQSCCGHDGEPGC